MNDERLGKEIGEFYRETDVAPPDSMESAHQVKARLSQVPQLKQRRWMPAWFQRVDRPTTIHAPDDPTPEVTGRTRSMFSPVKAITAGAIVFAIGSAFLIAQPFGQPAVSVPGAESDASEAPAWVTATVVFGSCDFGETTVADSVTQERGMNCWGQKWISDDPRLDGEARVAHNADSFGTDEQSYSLVSSIVEVFNDAGGWLCTNADRVASPADTLYQTSRFDGDRLDCAGYGDNEGLSAILTADWVGSPMTVEGLVFPGEMPQMPEFPAAE